MKGIPPDDWKKQIDALRKPGAIRTIEWTPDMDAMILYARKGLNRVPWKELEGVFKARFGFGNGCTLRLRYLELMKVRP